jgi:predicted DNA-binding transcriptional regulator YafY
MEELCRVLGSNYRTIYRDFEALRAAGFPVMNRYEGKMAVWSIGKWWDKTFDEI